ncbi:MAG: EAL domain-containing protein [Sulfitobacter sp.]|nr:EAL domain-containing protein [Sulfitobacter sp.]
MKLDQVTSQKGETILVIDDESVTRMMVRQVLEESKYWVEEAEDGAIGIEMARSVMPDLVLLDVRMPQINGFDTCRAIRELPGGAHVPILMLTGLDDVVSVQLAFESGATDFITKPINWALLAQRLNYALRTTDQGNRLRESEAQLAHAQRLARLGQWTLNLTGGSVALSTGLAEHLGFSTTGISAREVRYLIHRKDRLALYRSLRRVLTTGEPAEQEFRLTRLEGSVFTLHLYAERSDENRPLILQGTVQDVTARIEAEARISYFAHYDSLTDLPNRVLFWDRLTHSIAEAQRKNERFAVLMLDLDRFAALNSSIGHANGDRVIRRIAERLTGCLRRSDTLSRIGGDEFAIIYSDLGKVSDINHLLASIIEIFDQPIHEYGFNVHVSASVGIALYPDDGDALDDLMMHADVARMRAKSSPGSSYHFYTTAMGETARERMEMEAALRRALAEDTFELHYQPLVNLSDSTIWGVEALLRWQHPTLGLVLPTDFIGILEETGLMHDVGEWVLRRACEDMKTRDFVVSINISPVQFRNENLLARILGVLEETEFPPERLQIEITENVLIEDHQSTGATLESLREQRVVVAIDDFGTGFSSLSYLKVYDADFLKIDRLFIAGIQNEPSDAAIVRSTINLGHDLGMRIIGEGVENATALESLTHMGCDVAQGYLIARPLGLDALHEWLNARQS